MLLWAAIGFVAIIAAPWAYHRWQARHPERSGQAADKRDPESPGWEWLRWLVGIGMLGLMIASLKDLDNRGFSIEAAVRPGSPESGRWL